MGKPLTKIIVVGNLIHEDSFIMRMKESIKPDTEDKIFKAYPLLDQNDKILWPGKYPSLNAIEKEKSKLSTDAWMQEYLLKIVRKDSQVIQPEWIHYYDQLPKNYRDYLVCIATGVDPAISEEDTANCTAIVSAYVIHDENGDIKIYIIPNPINERMNFPKAIERIKALSITLGCCQQNYLYVEDVGFQCAIVQSLVEQGFQAVGVRPGRQDKRARLSLTSPLVHNGTILFPKNGAENLITQLVGFGWEKHNDLIDAFSMLILKVMEENYTAEPQLYIIDVNN